MRRVHVVRPAVFFFSPGRGQGRADDFDDDVKIKMNPIKYIVVFVTAKDKQQAQKIADGLLKARLIACANIIRDVQSFFWWQGKVDQAGEVLLIIKTKKVLFKKVVLKVKALHSYDVPEVIALPIVGGNFDYLKWIDESVD